MPTASGAISTTRAYAYSSGSKANLLRGFWKEETNRTVGKLLGDLLDYAVAEGQVPAGSPDLEGCRRAVARLMQDSPVPELDALTAISDERDFKVVAKAVRDAIERNQPEAGSTGCIRSSSSTCVPCAWRAESPCCGTMTA